MDFKYIDMHSHFFPPRIFRAIWNFFEKPLDDKSNRGWLIKYKLPTNELVQILESKNVKAFTTYNYAHKELLAEYINNWTRDFTKTHRNAIPFGCVWPGDKNLLEYVHRMLEEDNFIGIKVQPLGQNFYPYDKRMRGVYKLIVDLNKWYTIHAGTGPFSNQYLGYKTFLKFIEEFPNMNIIVAHMGVYEHEKFFSLLEKHENLYMDTAMVYVPENLYKRWKIDYEPPGKEYLLNYYDRILFGSDFPNIPFKYEYCSQALFDLDLSKKIYNDIFYNNAKRLFNISQ